MKPLLHVSDASLDEKMIAISYALDGGGRIHFRDAPLQSSAASRFTRIQEFALRGELSLTSPEMRIALSLVIFDGVATRADLEGALAAVNSVYRWNDDHCLDWVDQFGRINRRFLSVFTRAALVMPRLGTPLVSEVLCALDGILGQSIRGVRRSYSLDILFLDSQAWLAENVSDPLVAHCGRAAPMASLPKSALAREVTGFALQTEAAGTQDRFASEGLACAMGAYLDPSGADRGAWLVAELVQICRRNKTLSNAKDRQRMLEACRGLTQKAEVAGPISGLIVAWVIDLLESGTRAKRIIKAITPAKYVAAAADRLFNIFRGKKVEDISAKDFIKTYESMLTGLSSSRARTLASALSSWHFFLTCWFDVTPLYKSLHKWVPIVAPKANVLWPHEICLCRTWIKPQDGDERFHGQLRVAFEILVSIRIRASELLNLRICNIQPEGDALKVEVATRESDGGTKTPAGRRPQFLRDIGAIRLLRDWLDRRRNEGALPNDYLFGDPYRPERQYKSGQLYLTLNRLLKAVTGDDTVATHALSHTRVSFDWANAIGRELLADINPYEEGAVGSGHASAATGFACYFHFPERWLRVELDQVIAQRLGTWPSVRLHVPLTHSAFRQARSRALQRNRDLGTGVVALHLIERAAPSLIVPHVCSQWSVTDPLSPIRPQTVKPLDLTGTLNLIHDAWLGHSPKVIALRCGRPLDMVSTYASVALDVLRDIGELTRETRNPPGADPISALGGVLNGTVGLRIQIQRSGQDKAAHLFEHCGSHIEDDTVLAGIDSWKSCYQGGYVSLERPAAASGLASLLDAAGFPREFIALRGVGELDKKVESAIENLFRNGQSVMPKSFDIKPRYGRPRAYLALSSNTPKRCKNNELPNAALGMSGVHALMLGAAVCSTCMTLFAPKPIQVISDTKGEGIDD